MRKAKLPRVSKSQLAARAGISRATVIRYLAQPGAPKADRHGRFEPTAAGFLEAMQATDLDICRFMGLRQPEMIGVTMPNAANRVGHLFERMMMMQELVRLTIDNLPSSTDSDVPNALLNGLQEMLVKDCANAFRLSEAMHLMATMNSTDRRAEA